MNPSTIVTALGVILGAVGFTTDQSSAVQSVVAAGVALIIAVHTAVKAFERHKRNTVAVDAIRAKADLTHWQAVREGKPAPVHPADPPAPAPPPAVNPDGSAIPFTTGPAL